VNGPNCGRNSKYRLTNRFDLQHLNIVEDLLDEDQTMVAVVRKICTLSLVIGFYRVTMDIDAIENTKFKHDKVHSHEFGATIGLAIQGGSAPLQPPSNPPAHARCIRSDTTTHAKNITHTQHSPTCCFLCIQGVTGLHSQKSRATMPMDPLHQENFSVLTDFVNESATFFKVSTFISDTFFSSIMSLTK
jgi:hypothetical protein